MASSPNLNPDTSALPTFWALSAPDLLTRLITQETGLSQKEVQKIRLTAGPNRIKPTHDSSTVGLFIRQFKSPISFILISAAILSFFLHETTDGLIILTIILISGLLSFWRERGASNAMKQLQSIIIAKTIGLATYSWRFGFTQMPLSLYGVIMGVGVGYVLSAEGLKHWFYRRYQP